MSGAWPRASWRSTVTTVRLRDRYVGGVLLPQQLRKGTVVSVHGHVR